MCRHHVNLWRNKEDRIQKVAEELYSDGEERRWGGSGGSSHAELTSSRCFRFPRLTSESRGERL